MIAPVVVFAAWEGELDVLRLLLENGADPNVPGSAESALYIAVRVGPSRQAPAHYLDPRLVSCVPVRIAGEQFAVGQLHGVAKAAA
jgi:hypothetical protein